MSLFDLIWIAVILYAIFNGLGRRKQSSRTKLPDAEPQDRDGSARLGPVEEIRRKLVDAAREWEEEQRRLRGEPPAAAPTPPARVTPQPPSPPSRRRETSIQSARDVTPARLPAAEREPAAVLTPTPVVARSRPKRATSEAARVKREVERESAAERIGARRGEGSDPLAALDRLPSLQRAILFGEILGRPKALEDLPDLLP